MEKRDFFEQLSQQVSDYIALTEEMLDTLIKLKEALVAFDAREVNRLLDEKLVISEQIVVLNSQVDQMMTKGYGEFSKKSSEQLILDFDAIKRPWNKLMDLIKCLKKELFEIRQMLAILAKYNTELQDVIDQGQFKGYSPGAKLIPDG